jgi:hypothetical protein
VLLAIAALFTPQYRLISSHYQLTIPDVDRGGPQSSST